MSMHEAEIKGGNGWLPNRMRANGWISEHHVNHAVYVRGAVAPKIRVLHSVDSDAIEWTVFDIHFGKWPTAPVGPSEVPRQRAEDMKFVQRAGKRLWHDVSFHCHHKKCFAYQGRVKESLMYMFSAIGYWGANILVGDCNKTA